LQLAIMNTQVKWPVVPTPYPGALHKFVTWMLQPQPAMCPDINVVLLHVKKLWKISHLKPDCIVCSDFSSLYNCKGNVVVKSQFILEACSLKVQAAVVPSTVFQWHRWEAPVSAAEP
jgi:hypothetical protein